jgi:hypothetical protein
MLERTSERFLVMDGGEGGRMVVLEKRWRGRKKLWKVGEQNP